MKVALLVTCLTDTFYPRTGIAVVKVLEKLGCQVEFPKAQTCCGQPMWNNGFADEAKALAVRMAKVFADYDYVVTPSGSCCAMIRDYYEEMFEDDPATLELIKPFVARTYEFVEFLLKVLKVDLREHGVHWDGKVTYHYSCHLRGIGVTDEAVRVMKQIEGLEHIPLEKSEQCCGFGGTFAMKFAEVSSNMVEDKVECIRRTGAPTVVVNDAGCAMNISGKCSREKHEVGFLSLAEIIAEGMGLLETGGE